MKVAIAPDSFKGSASADVIADAIGRGWLSVRPGDDVRLCPMADGGEGTLDAFAVAYPEARRVPVSVTGPDDQTVNAEFLQLDDGTAVVELASTSGIGLTDLRRPLAAHTRGFGQAIAAALRMGARQLVLAIGGSGSTDGGVGMLRELGGSFVDDAGAEIADGGGSLADLVSADLTSLVALPPGGVTVLTDVTSPLAGALGAAFVFSPQKGADDEQVRQLDDALMHLADVLAVSGDVPGAGAAGGTGYALLAWGAHLVPGAEGVADAIGLRRSMVWADVVITGEGRFDGQSSFGKVPYFVRHLAEDLHHPAYLVAGLVDAATDGFAEAISLVDLAGSAEASMADPRRYSEAAGCSLARRTLDHYS